jgi:hypothetical protein
VVLERFRDDFPSLLQGAALSVSQAGYNTVLDVVASGVRAVVVPYEGSGDEQPLRARILAERGLFQVVPEAELSPGRLAEAMQEALAKPPVPAPLGLDSTGDPIMNLPWTQAGLPAINLPFGADPEGLPLGVQLVSRWYDDERLLTWATMIESELRDPSRALASPEGTGSGPARGT